MVFRSLGVTSLVLVLLVSNAAARAQDEASALTPELAFRIQVVLFGKMQLPPQTSFRFGDRTMCEIPGYDRVDVGYSSPDGIHGTFPLLVSKDGSKLLISKEDTEIFISQDDEKEPPYTAYDISADPREKLQVSDRPPRGGPADAPVLMVVFDDLECPFCAHLNVELFPALLDRYKDSVRIVYRNFPLKDHLWATHAAVDVDCLGSESTAAYWAAVDRIHAHFSEYGRAARLLTKAEDEIDAEVKKQGEAYQVDGARLDACIAKQDTAPEVASTRLGASLGVEARPTTFINGLKVVGALPTEYIFGLIDDALRAEGKTPPPPYVPVKTGAATPATGKAKPPSPTAK